MQDLVEQNRQKPRRKLALSTRISLVALALSLVSFAFSSWYAIRSVRTSVRPVIAIEYEGKTGWLVRNLGSGPALNVTVALGSERDAWEKPVRLPPLSTGASFALSWVGHTSVRTIGVEYQDLDGRHYSSVCMDDLVRVRRGKTLPEWGELEIEKHWSTTPLVGD